MSKYKFRADELSNAYASQGGRWIYVEMDMTTPQAKDAFLTLAGDTRGDELTLWMAELGYTITEIETIDCDKNENK
jgi:hypothetical protein